MVSQLYILQLWNHVADDNGARDSLIKSTVTAFARWNRDIHLDLILPDTWFPEDSASDAGSIG